MSEHALKIIIDQNHVSSDMATIIGRYKGSIEVYERELAEISQMEGVSSYFKTRLEWLTKSMRRVITENEELWEKRGKREPVDINFNK